MSPSPQGSGSMTPGTQGSGSMTPEHARFGQLTPGPGPGGTTRASAQGSGSMTPGTQGSGSYNPGGTPPAGSSSTDSAAYQQQMFNSAQGSQPQGSGSSGTTPAGSSAGAGYNPSPATPGGSSTPPANYPGGAMPGYNPQGSSPDSSAAPTPYGMGGQPGGDPNNPGYPGAGNVPGQQPAKPLTLADKADLAFRQARGQDAIQYLYAHGVTADAQAAKEVLDKMGWITPLKRPAMAVRWGIAVEYVARGGYNGSIFPIGTTQNIPIKGRPGGGRRRPAERGAWVMAAWAPAKAVLLLQQLTGELGSKVMGQFVGRIGRGDFGKVLALDLESARSGRRWHGSRRGMPGYTAPGSGGEMSGGMAPGYSGPAAGGFGQPQAAPSTDIIPMGPGLVLLGVVSTKDLREKGTESRRRRGLRLRCRRDRQSPYGADQERNHDSPARFGPGEGTVRIEDAQ